MNSIDKTALLNAVKNRHSVRAYDSRPIPEDIIAKLNEYVAEVNAASGLNVQLVTEEPDAFGKSLLAKYGKFSGVKNYFALVGKRNSETDEKAGYFGEKLVLIAQALGLNTCWVALTYKRIKSAFKVEKDEKTVAVISLGYGVNQGVPSKNKSIDKICELNEYSPPWFKNGVKCALLAPTAINQQKFFFSQSDGVVTAKAGNGPCAKIDLGIVKYHFELGAGEENFKWNEKL